MIIVSAWAATIESTACLPKAIKEVQAVAFARLTGVCAVSVLLASHVSSANASTVPCLSFFEYLPCRRHRESVLDCQRNVQSRLQDRDRVLSRLGKHTKHTYYSA
jgi:hypothetical protein